MLLPIHFSWSRNIASGLPGRAQPILSWQDKGLSAWGTVWHLFPLASGKLLKEHVLPPYPQVYPPHPQEWSCHSLRLVPCSQSLLGMGWVSPHLASPKERSHEASPNLCKTHPPSSPQKSTCLSSSGKVQLGSPGFSGHSWLSP